MKKIKIVVIDGQGGRLGSSLISQIKKEENRTTDLEVTAIGTNAMATSAMLKAGADNGATGEYPVLYHASRADIIVGPIGVVVAGALCGEISPHMAEAVGLSSAEKILIPSDRCSVHVVGRRQPLEDYIAEAVQAVKDAVNDRTDA